MEQDIKDKMWNLAGVILAGFAGLCFITSLAMSSDSGRAHKFYTSAQGGIVGPISVEEANTVYEVDISQSVNQTNNWSFVEGSVLNDKKEYLFGFGSELWRESGYDSDGSWNEHKDRFDIKITMPEKGVFYLSFKTQASTSALSKIKVVVQRKAGSSVAHFAMGVIAAIIGMGILIMRNRLWENIEWD